ncbi:acyltransferase [Bradyrhizobium sp. DASA03007]|uniref:acyltransferase n=1 Tax=unclassified Bradyrhizobium TaxID=2631580 RepID=UPI003F7022CE
MTANWTRIRRATGVFLRGVLESILASSLIPARIRTSALRIAGVDIGKGCYINPGVRFRLGSIRLGEFCAVNSATILDGTGTLLIGDRVHIGWGSILLTGTHTIRPSVYRRDRNEPNQAKVTTVERGCWLGSGVIVLPGVTIAEGCVIGAGSVVVENTEPNGLYVGSPAVRRKDLSLEEQL